MSDKQKRKIYDRYGYDGLKDQAGFDSNSFHFDIKDFFKDHFGNSFMSDDEFGDGLFGNHFEFHSNHHHQQHHQQHHHSQR